jgi:hypothetical protein
MVTVCTDLRRRMSFRRAGELFRAMNGDREYQQGVTLDEVIWLDYADTFAEFVIVNADRLQLYDEKE